MEKIKPFWRIVIGAAIFFNAVYSSSNLAFGGSFFGFAVWWAALVAYIFLCVKIKYDDPVRSMRDLMAQQAEREKLRQEQEKAESLARWKEEQQAALEKRKAELAEREAARDEFERTHGRIITAVAGVTFKNDDGISRQNILKDFKARGDYDADLELEEYEYKGKPAIRVLVDGEQIGNIPRSRVGEVSAVLDRLEDCSSRGRKFESSHSDQIKACSFNDYRLFALLPTFVSGTNYPQDYPLMKTKTPGF